jgi:glycerol-3-phosphate acyltransferase PlsY
VNIWILISCALGGYLIGSVSMARFVLRTFGGRGVRPVSEVGIEGSDQMFQIGFVSATTVSMTLGSRYGFLTMVLDIFKIAVPALIVKHAFYGEYYFLAVAIAGAIGHVWPLYFKFKGGRGMSAVYGGLIAVDWVGVFPTSLAGMLLGLLVFRDILTAYVAGVVLIIPWLWIRFHNMYFLGFGIAVNLIFIAAALPEIRQWKRMRKESEWSDMTTVMELIGMGRGLLKMARWLGVIKDEAKGKKGEETEEGSKEP